MKKLKSTIYWLTVGIAVPCVVYYWSKFYCDGHIEFTSRALPLWTVICSLLILSLIVGFVNMIHIKRLEEQNRKLQEIIIRNHYENISFQKNTREIMMEDGKID